MDRETCISMCRGLAKAYSTGVRLFEGEQLLFYESVSCMEPDPLGPFLAQVLEAPARAGVITTPLHQFYGFLTLREGWRLVLGPTCMLEESGKEVELLLAMLKVEPARRESYLRLLRSDPVINGDRFAWLLASLATALSGEAFPVEDVWFQIRPASSRAQVLSDYARRQIEAADDPEAARTVEQSYAWEQMILSYVENGRTGALRELFCAPPNIVAGRIAYDELRQSKNMGLCTATGAARAAIRGGVPPRMALGLSDLYIQKLELLRDVAAVEQLIREMLLDFAAQVEKLRCPGGGDSRFYQRCARYVSENLYTALRAEEMAAALGYTRSYLCTRFHQETGMSLKQYIQREKAMEARRLLRFTDQELGRIAALLDFSSQSHFQTVFKKVTGETPMAYRRRTRGAEQDMSGIF